MRYRNVRTADVVDPDPGSELESFVRSHPDVWQPIDETGTPVELAPRPRVPCPPPSAGKAAWVAYAVSLGVPEADAVACTQTQLVDLYIDAEV